MKLVRGKGKSLEELRAVHDWQIAPQLRSVRGVAEVNAWGGAEKQKPQVFRFKRKD